MRAQSVLPSLMARTSRAISSRTVRRAHWSSFITSVLPDAPSRPASVAGASAVRGGVGKAHQKGSRSFINHAFTFAPSQPVQQLVQGLFFFVEAPMEQAHFSLLGRIDAPSIVPPSLVTKARSYRDAVRLCWELRRAKGLKVSDLGRDHGFTRQHVSDYLNVDDKPKRRSLPAHRIVDFEDLCGNSAVSQWLAAQARLTILEEIQAARAAA